MLTERDRERERLMAIRIVFSLSLSLRSINVPIGSSISTIICWLNYVNEQKVGIDSIRIFRLNLLMV